MYLFGQDISVVGHNTVIQGKIFKMDLHRCYHAVNNVYEMRVYTFVLTFS